MPVDPRPVVLLEAEVERREARDRRRHADGALRLELGQQRAGCLDGGLHVLAVALGEAHRAERQARPEVVEDELGRAAADVDEQRRRRELADAPLRQLRLLVAREQLRREAVAPLDLAEERFAVLRVADGARRDEQRPVGAERLGSAAVVGEGVAHARDRKGEEAMARVDAFAEAGDPRLAVQLVDASVLDAPDEEPRRVRPEVYCRDDHL